MPRVFLYGYQNQKKKNMMYLLQDEFTYNSNTTSQNNTKIHYNTNTLRFNGTIYIKKVWSVITDYQFYSRQKTPQFNTNLNYQSMECPPATYFQKQ